MKVSCFKSGVKKNNFISMSSGSWSLTPSLPIILIFDYVISTETSNFVASKSSFINPSSLLTLLVKGVQLSPEVSVHVPVLKVGMVKSNSISVYDEVSPKPRSHTWGFPVISPAVILSIVG